MNFRSRTCLDWLAALAAATSVGLSGCAGDESVSYSFVSDDPSGMLVLGKSGPPPGPSGSGSAGPSDPGFDDDDAELAIAEADIIQVKDGKLYALSKNADLTIIDISGKDHLTVLGKRALKGIPFEMYLRDGTAYAILSDGEQFTYDAATQTSKWFHSSHVEALDVTNPAAIGSLGSLDLPGDISDSHVVGDVLYAVSYEGSFCVGCTDTKPRATVTSIALGNPASIHKVDQLGLSESTMWSVEGSRPSVSFTPQRVYVTDVDEDHSGEGAKTINIVDISDPTGHLTLGASVNAKGSISSSWKMDEYNGVLRVVSQPDLSQPSSVLAVQTFTITSSQSVQPLGYMNMTLPKPRWLRSVRFDGARAFVSTTDFENPTEPDGPLFTLDLSDPAHPQQAGSLAIPGKNYRVEPRGDRLLALGFDNGNTEGSLNLSLFNIADLASATLLQRVAFGGTWPDVVEGEHRVHAAFSILPDQGLILIPYSGWRKGSGNDCGWTYESGIQLVDYSDTTLTKRGVALSHGQAKRAFLHDDWLFAVADDDVRSFDITNRSAPAKTAALPLAAKVDQALVVSDKVVRLSSDWWTDATKLEITSATTPDSASVLGSLDLTSLAVLVGPYQEGCYYEPSFFGAKLLAHGTDVYFIYPTNQGQVTRVAVISIADPAHPVITGQITVDAPFDAGGVYAHSQEYGGSDGYYYGGHGNNATIAPGEAIVQAGSTLVFRRPDVTASNTATQALHKEWLEVVDLSNPKNPKHAAMVELPEALGHTPLLIDGTTVLTSHWSPLDLDSGKVRFYLDRVDVASPSAPVLLPQVSIPGSLVTFDVDSGRLLTVDYQRLPTEKLTVSECEQKYNNIVQFTPNADDTQPGTCKPIQRSWKLLDVAGSQASLLDTRASKDNRFVLSVFVGDDRVFVYGWSHDEASSGPDPHTTKIEVVGGLASGHLEVATSSHSDIAYASPIAVAGKRLVLSSYEPPSIEVLDTTNLSSMVLTHQTKTAATVSSLVMNGDVALCPLGPDGLEVVDLSQ